MIVKKRRISLEVTRGRNSQTGLGSVEYILVLALLALVVVTGVAVTGGGVGHMLDSINGALQGNMRMTALPLPGGNDGDGNIALSIRPIGQAGEAIAGIEIYAFDSVGYYQDLEAITTGDGQAVFQSISAGSYAFRADYQAHEFWSPVVGIPSETSIEIETGLQPVEIKAVSADGIPLNDIDVYVFNSRDQYTGVTGKTDFNGIAQVNLVDGSFKVRVDYHGQPQWSQVFSTNDVTQVVTRIQEEPFTLQVVDRQNQPVEGVPVYAFNENNGYTAIHSITDRDGEAVMNLPGGIYIFRADHLGESYWSIIVSSPEVNVATIRVGQPPMSVHVANQTGSGVEGITVYAFENNPEEYSGISAVTDVEGVAYFSLNEGVYLFRADYSNDSYWSDHVAVPEEDSSNILIEEYAFNVTVIESGNQAVPNDVYVYAFSVMRDGESIDYYLADDRPLDDDGIAAFDLPQGEYRFLAYAGTDEAEARSSQDWSEIVSIPQVFNLTIRMQ